MEWTEGPDGAAARAPAPARKLQFFQVAEPLFERFGYRKTTVEEICRAAGASKRTFYEIFRDKADLAQQLLLHVASDMVRRQRERVAPEMTPLDKLDLLLEEYVRVGREHQVLRALMRDPDLLSTFGEHVDDLQFTAMIGAMRDILDEGIASGQFRRHDSNAAAWMIFALLDSMYYLIPEYSMGPGAFEDPRLARELREFVVHALLDPRRAEEDRP
jgi:AcrR family transcriptional regulator